MVAHRTVGAGRLELPTLAGYGSEPYAYTNSATHPTSLFYFKPAGTTSDSGSFPSHRISPRTTKFVIFGCHSCSALFTALAISSADIPFVRGTRYSKKTGPRSYSSVTKCIEHPDSVISPASNAAFTASCTRCPHMPGPPNLPPSCERSAG